MPDIELRNAALAFDDPGGGPPKVVYEKLDLKVESGSFTVVLGPSGCGKSTLLNIVDGLLEPTSVDAILVDGKDIRQHRELTRRMAYIFQGPRLLPWKTLQGNVEFGLRGLAVQPQERWRELMQKYFAVVGLTEYVDYYPHQVSGGMQQRAAIVRAWANEPEILLMDEPFSHLDEISAGELRRELMDLWLRDEPRRTILFVTHNLREAAYLASDIVVMTKAPARICHREHVDLPWPRDPSDERVFALESKIRKVLEAEAGIRV